MMGRNQSEEEEFEEEDLTDMVITWSVDQIFDAEQYSQKVNKIPDNFLSLPHYFQSFVMPLMEETRAELQACLESLQEQPSAEVLFVDVDVSKSKKKPASKFVYVINTDPWITEAGHSNSELYRPINNDILILSSLKPESISDLDRYGAEYWLVCVTKVDELEEDGENVNVEGVKGVRIKSSKEIRVTRRTTNMVNCMYATFLTNIVTNNRIWKALKWGYMGRDLHIMQKIVDMKEMDAFEDNYLIGQCDSKVEEILEKLNSLNLNESQLSAVTSSISNIMTESPNPVKIIWGPPGTGKTKTVSSLLLSLLTLKCRVLACAPTNVAVLEICRRLLPLHKEWREHGTDSEQGLPCPMGDIILFGNKKRLKVDDYLEDVFLDHRVKQLRTCFVPATGWRNRLDSMLDLFQDGLHHYKISLENETELTYSSFKMYLSRRVHVVAKEFVEMIRIFWTHLPSPYISVLHSSDILVLLNMLNRFDCILSQDHLSEEDLNNVFAENIDADSCCNYGDNRLTDCVESTVMWLSKARKVCLQSLTMLRASLQLPHLVSRASIREFCLRCATLYFCSVSSSSLLFYIPVKDLDVLVIDEAAQLKECESAIPLGLRRLHHVVLIGDECQLPSVVKSQISMEAGFGRSLFKRLVAIGHPKHLLNIQYRMHPAICSFPNAKFYDNQIINGPNVIKPNYGRVYLPETIYGPFSFININEGREEKDDFGTSRKNLVEVAVVLRIIQRLLKVCWEHGQNLSVGVISPYSSQVAEICEKVKAIYDNQKGFSLNVKSIDGFQGGEEDIIILSTVRSNSGGSVGFIGNHNRTNVALTRARHCLWIVGNSSTLLRSDTVWKELVLDSKRRNCFFNADEDKNIAKAVVDVKHELDQLDDLLNPDSVLLRTARWKVLFSDYFKKSFAKLKFKQIRITVMQSILRLADGWRPKAKADDFLDSFQLARKCRTRDFYVVYTVDISKYNMYTQVLKVWDVIPSADVPKIAKRLEAIFAMLDEDYIEHCRTKCIEGKLEIPMTWRIETALQWRRKFRDNKQPAVPSDGEIESNEYLENSKVNDSLLLMKFYALSSGVVKHLLTAAGGDEIEIPFEVTDHEKEIIMSPSSAFILGRSGTGKTTVLTMKLIRNEQQHCISYQGLDDDMFDARRTEDNVEGNNEGGLRQIFVTVSPKLCSAIKNQITRFQSFVKEVKLSSGSPPLQMFDINDDFDEFADIPENFIDLLPKHYPLVITLQKFLLMLDGTVGNSFFDGFQDSKDVLTSEFPKSLAVQSVMQNKQVNYEKFANIYWPHFNSLRTRRLDPSTVFVQIISHIKGGLMTDSMEGKIQRADYINLSGSRQSLLDEEQRDRIYDIFIDYEHEKRLKGEFDLSDFVADLHKRLSSDGFAGSKIDFVYIDEVQDLTMKQISLFKHVCKNVLDGFVFAGDTAQTIAKGVDFRFQDIRSLFYSEFMPEVIQEYKRKGKKEPAISDVFQLNQNFRTHDAILRLAQSVVVMVYHFFPWSIDILKPETSFIYGETPVVLDSGDNNAIVTIFGNNASASKGNTGFGAEQAIIVRDDDEKQKVLRSTEKQALVLTIVECKGLEFQDVLLYNFFGSSPLRNHWRVIYNYMKESNFLDSNSLKFPLFDKYKHNLLCSELKQLYVAITRTRQRLWLCESDNDFCRPMFDYWIKVGVVQVKYLDESLMQAMRVVSSADDWRTRGIKLFNEQNFEMATMCFERAGDSFREKWSRAAGLSMNAEINLASNFEAAHTAFRQAAEIYETIGKFEAAAKCFFKLKEYKKAGTIYKEKCDRLIDAGDCFVLAECWTLAAEVFASAKCFSKCLDSCSRGKLFDHGLSLIEQWEAIENQEVEDIKTKFLESCATHYLDIGDKRSMMKSVQAFPSLAMQRSFLWGHKLLNELIHLEIASNNFVEAVSIAHSMGNLLLEAEILEKAGDFEQAAKLLLFFVLNKSFWVSGNNGWPMKCLAGQDELINRARHLSKKTSNSFCKKFTTKIDLLFEKTNWLKLSEVYDNYFELDDPFFKVFSARKIVDLHLQSAAKYNWEPKGSTEVQVRRMFSESTCSVETLVYFWDLWKDQLMNLLSFLNILDSVEDSTSKFECHAYEEFCLEYFGVRKEEDNNIYVAYFPEASWIDKSFGAATLAPNLIRLNHVQFSSCAKIYWEAEIGSVGLKILESLESLYRFSTKGSFPLFIQGKIILELHKVLKFLYDPNVNFPKSSAWKLRKFLSMPSSFFFDIIFPFNVNSELTENMIYLRQNDHAISVLEDIILKNLERGPTYGQVGRVVMILFVTGKMSDELHQNISAHFDSKYEWKACIDQMKIYFDSGFGWPALVDKLSLAMESTYNANWIRETDYINPHCFFYILECLLFLASSWRGSAGFFFTTKTVVADMLICSHWKAPLECYLTLPDPSFGYTASNILNVIVDTAYNLLSSKASMKEWLKKSNSGSVSSVLPILTLRLVMIILSAHLNTGQYWSIIMDIFRNSSVTNELPQEFRQKIRPRHNCDLPKMVAEALDAIGDSLVVVGPERSSERFNLKAIFVTPTTIQSRNELLELLFPKKNESDEHDHSCTEVGQATSTLGTNISTTECRSDPVPAINKSQERNEIMAEGESKELHGGVHCRFKDFWDYIDKILIQEFDVEKLPSIVDGTMLELEKKISALEAALACLVVDDDQPNDANYALLGEMKCLANEIKDLYNNLELRKKPMEVTISSLKNFCSEACAKKSRLKSLPDLKIKKNDLELAIENPAPLPTSSEQASLTVEVKDEGSADDPGKSLQTAGNSVSSGQSKHAIKKAAKNKGKGKGKGKSKKNNR